MDHPLGAVGPLATRRERRVVQIATDKIQLAAEGTGLVDDFGCLELAAALKRSVESVTAPVVDLLNLEVPLPGLCEQVLAGHLALWQGREAARATAGLSLTQARWVDATVTPFATRLAPRRLARFVEALVVQADPAVTEARWARAGGRRVEVGVMSREGLRDVYDWLAAADATYLDAALDQLSGSWPPRGRRRPPTSAGRVRLGSSPSLPAHWP